MTDMNNSINEIYTSKPAKVAFSGAKEDVAPICDCPKCEEGVKNPTDLGKDPLASIGRSQVKSTNFTSLDAKTSDNVDRTLENLELLNGYDQKMVNGMMNLAQY